MNKSRANSFGTSAFGDRSQAQTQRYSAGEEIFTQGQVADAMFQVEQGTVKLSVSSSAKKLAGLSLLRPGDCFGEGCLVAGELRTHTATSLDHSRIRRIGKASLTQRLRKELPFAWLFVTHLLLRIRQAEESRADHLLNSSEKRLARLLLQLGGYKPTLHQGRQPRPERLDVSQAVLADIVGTTRSRVSYFMNRFREKGLIAYDIGGIQVRSGLLNFVLRG